MSRFTAQGDHPTPGGIIVLRNLHDRLVKDPCLSLALVSSALEAILNGPLGRDFLAAYPQQHKSAAQIATYAGEGIRAVTNLAPFKVYDILVLAQKETRVLLDFARSYLEDKELAPKGNPAASLLAASHDYLDMILDIGVPPPLADGNRLGQVWALSSQSRIGSRVFNPFITARFVSELCLLIRMPGQKPSNVTLSDCFNDLRAMVLNRMPHTVEAHEAKTLDFENCRDVMSNYAKSLRQLSNGHQFAYFDSVVRNLAARLYVLASLFEEPKSKKKHYRKSAEIYTLDTGGCTPRSPHPPTLTYEPFRPSGS